MPEQQASQPTPTAGQCPAQYRIIGWCFIDPEVDQYGGAYTLPFDVSLYGPISRPRQVDEDINEGEWRYQRTIFIDGYDANGNPTNLWGWLKSSLKADTDAFQMQIDSIQRIDGQPDTCGDPPLAEDPNANPFNLNEENNCCTASAAFNSQVELHSGAVVETHDLVPYQSSGVSRGLTLRYNSLQADPRPIVHFSYSNLYSQPDYDRLVIAKLSVRRGAFEFQVPGFAGGQYGLTGSEHFWSIPKAVRSARPLRIDASLQVDLRSQPSGQYQYSLQRSIQPFDRVSPQFSPLLELETGKLLVVNSIDSPFGSGWRLAGLQELVQNEDGSVLLIDGNGSKQLFQAPAQSGAPYGSPHGDFSKLEQLADGTFRRMLKDQTTYTFNPQNQLEQVSDRQGNETDYLYDGAGQLTKIVDPVGLETTLTYTGNKVSAISDPVGRVTRLEYDTTGNLIQIIDPDGAQYIWEYDADHHMTANIDPRGNRGQDFYDFAGRATRATRKDSSVVEVTPVEVKGLSRPEATIDLFTAPPPFNLYSADIGAPTVVSMAIAIR